MHAGIASSAQSTALRGLILFGQTPCLCYGKSRAAVKNPLGFSKTLVHLTCSGVSLLH